MYLHYLDWLTHATKTSTTSGVRDVTGCQSWGAQLTSDGQALFPDLVNSDIDHSAGPCHNHFENYEDTGFRTLAVDYHNRAYIIINRGTIEGTHVCFAEACVCDVVDTQLFETYY